jgi:lipid-binding SYLF domain-containing protein
MLKKSTFVALLLALSMSAHAAGYTDTLDVFRRAGESGGFFKNSYAYAVFPRVAAGAVGVGGAYGKGRVYVHDQYVGDVTMGQVSIGLQLGGKTYSQIIFFEDQHALDQFESGAFEFGADASAVAITAGANAQIATNGVSTGRSQNAGSATTQGQWQTGMAVFVVARVGLMASAAIGGQRFSYEPKGSSK